MEGSISFLKEENGMDINVVQENNEERGLFCAMSGGNVEGLLSYIWEDKKHMLVYYTKSVIETADSEEIKKALIEAAIDYARKSQIKIIPLSTYAKEFFEQDEEFKDVLDKIS
jgi:predicted GNAT family acetyltransferase